MSVFKRPSTQVYFYDFRIRGRRFSGTTGCTTKRAAEDFEKTKRREAENAEIDTSKPMTFEVAASLYWHEVGQHHSDPSGPERNLAWLSKQIGKATLVSAIDEPMLARLVAKRRGEGVANATVNRSVIEPLRTILNRAADVWGAKIKTIDFGRHRLKEPQERVREASADEEARAIAAMPSAYQPALQFALLTGCRRGEIVGLTWSMVNFFSREFRVLGKGDISRTIPMTQTVYNLLWSLKDHHQTAVFSYVAQRVRDGRGRGKRYPITAAGFQTAWTRHGKPTLENFRFHDTRHTAATRLVRSTGNLKMAQKLLGHSTLATTARYAHVTHDDLRSGLETAERAKITMPTTMSAPEGADNALMKKENLE